MTGLVIGSASCVWDDLAAWTDPADVVIAANRIGVGYPGRIDHWVSLHADKLAVWTTQRAAAGFNMDFTTWTRPHARQLTDRVLEGWSGGSSGFLGVGVALEIGCDRVILCGVPIDDRPRFYGEGAWDCFPTYRPRWERRLPEMVGRVFSLSGWTRDLLGAPPCPACDGHGHGDPPQGHGKRYPVCPTCKSTGAICLDAAERVTRLA